MTIFSAAPDTSQRLIGRHGLDEPPGAGPFSYFAGDEIAIAGWAFLERVAPTLNAIAIEVVNTQSGAVTPLDVQRSARPDVASHFGSDDLLMSGFTCRFRIDYRLHGEYCARLLQMDGPTIHSCCDLFSFTIQPTAYETSVRTELASRFLRGRGLEIGALQRPLRVPDHCRVTYVDRLPLRELLAHYPELHGQPIRQPDLIDDGETLGRVEANSQDFVIANHFLEHCQNPIQTLLNMSRVLKDGGILYMAVPDKRFTFDIERPVTPYAVLAETFRQGYRSNREVLYTEWAARVNRTSPSEVEAVARKLRDEHYSIHFNVWTLPDLLEFIARSTAECGLPVTLEWVVCSANEVIMILAKRPAPNGIERHQARHII